MAIGRPTLLTPELSARICELIQEGNPPETAAESVGISRKTIWNWLLRGEEDDGIYADFLQSVRKARAFAAIRMNRLLLDGISQTAAERNDTRCALEWLKRREHKLWEPPKQVEVSGIPHATEGITDMSSELKKAKAVVAALESALYPGTPKDLK